MNNKRVFINNIRLSDVLICKYYVVSLIILRLFMHIMKIYNNPKSEYCSYDVFYYLLEKIFINNIGVKYKIHFKYL